MWNESSTMDSPMSDYDAITIEDLPEEILLHIFSFVNVEDLVKGISNVSDHWNCLAQCPNLWNSIRIFPAPESKKVAEEIVEKFFQCCNYLTPEETLLVLTKAVNLHALDLYRTLDANDVLEKICSIHPPLKSLFIWNCTVRSNVLVELSVACSNIQHLELDGNINIVGISGFTSFSHFVNLRHLRLGSNFNILNVTTLDIATVFRALINLERLEIIAENLKEQHLVVLKELRNSLLHLELGAGKISNTGLPMILECTKLQTLHLNDAANITEEGLQSLSQLRDLEDLQIWSGESLTSQDMQNFSKICSNLKVLALPFCRAVDDIVLYGMAYHCHNLRSLHIGWCSEVTDKGLENLAQCCHGLRELKVPFIRQLKGTWLKRQEAFPRLLLLDVRGCIHLDTDKLLAFGERRFALRILGP